MNKEHVTKGPVPDPEPGSDNGWATMTIQHEGLHVVVTAPHASEMDNGEWDHPEKVVEAEANAYLIHEAFSVLHETGYTPRELAEQVKELREALQTLADTAFNVSANGDKDISFALDPDADHARAILSKYQPVTPEP